MSVLAIGTLIQQGDGATPTENWTTIGEVKSISADLKTVVKETTNHSSPNRTVERRAVLKDSGSLKFGINHDPLDSTHALILADWQNFTIRHYRMVLPTDTPTKRMYTAFVDTASEQYPVDNVMMSDVTLTNAVAPQFTGVT